VVAAEGDDIPAGRGARDPHRDAQDLAAGARVPHLVGPGMDRAEQVGERDLVG
jgi:hypothetical protein